MRLSAMSRSSSLSRRTAIALALAGLAGPAQAQPLDQVRLLLDWLPTGDYAAYYAGIDQGFYREAGIQLTVERGFGSSDTVTKVASGVAQFGIADIGSVMAGRVRAQAPVRAIASIYTRPPHSIFVLADSGIRTFKDLEGRSLAGAPGSAVRVFLPLVLQRNNVDITRINLINSEPATMGPLLVSGRADAVTGFLSNLPRFEAMAREANKTVSVLQFSESLEIYGNALIASETTIGQAPDLVRRFVAATLRSIAYARANPRAAVEAMVKVVPGLNVESDTRAMEIANSLTFDSPVARVNPVGSFDAVQLARTWQLVAEAQQLAATGVDPESFVTRSFLPQR